METTYTLKVAGLTRELPICKASDKMSIAAFVMFNDVELTVACRGGPAGKGARV